MGYPITRGKPGPSKPFLCYWPPRFPVSAPYSAERLRLVIEGGAALKTSEALGAWTGALCAVSQTA